MQPNLIPSLSVPGGGGNGSAGATSWPARRDCTRKCSGKSATSGLARRAAPAWPIPGRETSPAVPRGGHGGLSATCARRYDARLRSFLP